MEKVLWQIGKNSLKIGYAKKKYSSIWIFTRLLELTNTISASGSNKQVLDKLKVERERGITVKAQVRIKLIWHGPYLSLHFNDFPTCRPFPCFIITKALNIY